MLARELTAPVLLKNCGGLIHPPSLEGEGEYYVGQGDYLIREDGLVQTMLSSGVARSIPSIDCKRKTAVVGAPATVIVRKIPNNVELHVRRMSTMLPYPTVNIVETGMSGSVEIHDLTRVETGRLKHSIISFTSEVLTENHLLKIIEEGKDLSEYLSSEKITLLAGMNRKTVFKIIRRLGKPILHYLGPYLRSGTGGTRTIVITNGWLTSSDIEALFGLSNARLVFCATNSLHLGLGAWLPLNELIAKGFKTRVSITVCRSAPYWWSHPVALALISTLVTRYYSWSRRITVADALDLVYNNPYPSNGGRLVIYLYRYKPNRIIEDPGEMPPLYEKPDALLIVRLPQR